MSARIKKIKEDAAKRDSPHSKVPSKTEMSQAKRYTIDDLEKFFITKYRPAVTRSKIFGQLRKIRMRKNESPTATLDRIETALEYARDTIELLNTENGFQMGEITDTDRRDLLIYVFCTKNVIPNVNDGEINKMMAQRVRIKELKHDITEWRAVATAITTRISTAYFTGIDKFKIIHYEPIPLPFWEVTTQKTDPQSKQKIKSQQPKNNRKRRRETETTDSQAPPRKKRRKNDNINADKKEIPGKQCWRCGRTNHTCHDCHAVVDVNGHSFKVSDRRNLNEMPFKKPFRGNKKGKTKWKKYNDKPDSTQIRNKDNNNNNHLSVTLSEDQISTLFTLQQQAMQQPDTNQSIVSLLGSLTENVKPPRRT